MTLFPTFVVGSLPRPLWIRELIEARKRKQVADADAARLLDGAIPFAIRMQERCGLDFVSDGEWRRESYVKVFADAVEGFQPDLISGGGSQFSALRYPAIVSKVVPRRPIAADEAAFVRAHTQRKVIVALPSPYTIGWRMWSPEYSTACYATREDFMQACIPVIRDEIRALAGAGIDAVQLDDPWLVQLVDPAYRKRAGIRDIEHEVEQCVRCINEATQGIEDVLLSVHLCHAHFHRQHATAGPYDLIIDGLRRMNVDRFAMEFATPDAGDLDALRQFPRGKMLGLGVIDHTDRHVETPQEVVARVEQAMDYVPKEQISLNPDCGFAPSSANPMDLDEAYAKLQSMCLAAGILRERHS